MEKRNINSTLNAMFWFHLILTILALTGPFLFSWYLMVPAYLIVLLQFAVFKKCLMNDTHDLDDGEDATFYSTLFESMGFSPNRKVLKLIVRRYLYIVMSIVTLAWQLWLGHAPILF
jgi:uncharacterized membrane protein (DUF4010 family)